MNVIVHRVNTVAGLVAVPLERGVEVDLRTKGGRIILQHEPSADGPDFRTWLKSFRHGTLILNVKEDGLEDRARDLVLSRGIRDFFFLDLSFPALIRMVRSGERRVAVRVSEFEPPAAAMRLAGKAAWVWLDCFTPRPWDARVAAALARKFRVCAVSPEVQGHPASLIPAFRRRFERAAAVRGALPAGVCTKVPDLWL